MNNFYGVLRNNSNSKSVCHCFAIYSSCINPNCANNKLGKMSSCLMLFISVTIKIYKCLYIMSVDVNRLFV